MPQYWPWKLYILTISKCFGTLKVIKHNDHDHPQSGISTPLSIFKPKSCRKRVCRYCMRIYLGLLRWSVPPTSIWWARECCINLASYSLWCRLLVYQPQWLLQSLIYRSRFISKTLGILFFNKPTICYYDKVIWFIRV